MGKPAIRRPPEPVLERASLAIGTNGHFREKDPGGMGIESMEVDVGANHMNPNAQETANLASVSDATQHF